MGGAEKKEEAKSRRGRSRSVSPAPAKSEAQSAPNKTDLKEAKKDQGKQPEIFATELKDIDGETKTLGEYMKGKKAALVVNVASK
jgi:hypothetical protein